MRAATSVALNIAEGSTGQTDSEQARFIGLAIRSLLETVACLHIINRRKLLDTEESTQDAYRRAETWAARLHAMRKAISPEQTWLRESSATYDLDED